jgi:hypothetical protein
MYFTGPVGESSYTMTGDGMILYDFQLKKKYLYNPVADNANCLINNRCQIGRKSKLETSNHLFTFTHIKCTHAYKGNWMLTDDENFGIGPDRVPVPIGITHSEYKPHD